MKKFLTLAFFLMVVMLAVAPSVSFGAEATVNISINGGATTTRPAIVVATVGVRDARVVLHDKNLWRISFNLTNQEGAQSGVKYGIELRTADKGVLVDQAIYSEVLFLEENSKTHKEIIYEAPEYLKGKYKVWVISRNEGGLMLGLTTAGEIDLTGTGKYVDISNCSLKVAGDKNLYNLTQGVDVLPKEELSLNCSANNLLGEGVAITPHFKNTFRTVFGRVVSEKDGQAIQFKKGEKKKIILVIPKPNDPQAYDVAVTFAGVDGKKIANLIVAHYVLSGASGTIKNVTLDKDTYIKGDIAKASITWSGRADGFVGARREMLALEKTFIVISTFKENGQACADGLTKELGTNFFDKIEVPIKDDCRNGGMTFLLMNKNGNTLDQKTIEFKKEETKTVAPTSAPKDIKNLSTIIYIILGILFVIGLAIIIAKKIKDKKAIGTLILFLLLGVLVGGRVVRANSVCTGNVDPGFTNASFCWGGYAGGPYCPGDNVHVEGDAWVDACDNSNPHLDLSGGGIDIDVDANSGHGSADFWGPGTPGTYGISFHGLGYIFHGPFISLGRVTNTHITVTTDFGENYSVNTCTWCGDNSCNGSEDCWSCPEDCGVCVYDGACGPAKDRAYRNPPGVTDKLCNVGANSTVTTVGSNYVWTCYGSGGGSNASCSATIIPPCANAPFNSSTSSVSPALVPANGNYTVKCDYGITDPGAISVITGNGTCSPPSFSGTVATFNCAAVATTSATPFPISCKIINNYPASNYCEQPPNPVGSFNSCYDASAPMVEKPLSGLYNVATANGLFSYFPFDSMNVNDAKGGIVWESSGMPTPIASSKFSGGAIIPGASSVYSYSSLNLGASNFSACAWFKQTNNSPLLQDIFGMRKKDGAGQGGFEMRLDGSSNNLRASICTDSGCDTVLATPKPSINAWHQVCFVRDTSQVKLFVDGNLADSKTNNNRNITSPLPSFFLGMDNEESKGPDPKRFQGELDDVSLWKRALPDCEARSLYLGTNVCLPACSSSSCANAPFNSSTSSVSPALVPANGSYTVKCDYGFSDDPSAISVITDNGTCSAPSFSGTVATFDCAAGSATSATPFPVSCKVKNKYPTSNYCEQSPNPVGSFNSCYDASAPMVEKPLSSLYDIATEIGLFSYFPFNTSANDAKSNVAWQAGGEPNLTASSKFSGGAISPGARFPVLSSSNLGFGASNFSACAWFKQTNSNPAKQEIFGMRANPGYSELGFEMQLDGSSNNLRASICSSAGSCDTVLSSPKPSINAWHQVCFVRDTSQVKLFVDGNLADSKTNNNKSISFPPSLMLFVDNIEWKSSDINVNKLFNGELDDVSFWHRALSDCEAKILYFGTNVCLPACPSCTHLPFVTGSVSPATVTMGNSFTVKCDYGIAGIDAIGVPDTGGGGTCVWAGTSNPALGWDDNAAVFDCVAGANGNFPIACKINNYPMGSNYCASTDQIGGTVAPDVTITVPTDNAASTSCSAPSTVVADQSFTAQIGMRNSGGTNWTTAGGYKLKVSNPATWSASDIDSGSVIAGGSTTYITTTLTAPSIPALYNFDWRMYKGATPFGATNNMCGQITVTPSSGFNFAVENKLVLDINSYSGTTKSSPITIKVIPGPGFNSAVQFSVLNVAPAPISGMMSDFMVRGSSQGSNGTLNFADYSGASPVGTKLYITVPNTTPPGFRRITLEGRSGATVVTKTIDLEIINTGYKNQ